MYIHINELKGYKYLLPVANARLFFSADYFDYLSQIECKF